MTKYLIVYIIAFVIFILVDGIWLGVIAKSFYGKHLGYIMTDNIRWGAAFIFYLIFIVGLVYFVIVPNLESGFSIKFFVSAALFGLVTYATYDFTNLATIKDWPMLVTVVDTIWGMVLSLIVSGLTLWISKILKLA